MPAASVALLVALSVLAITVILWLHHRQQRTLSQMRKVNQKLSSDKVAYDTAFASQAVAVMNAEHALADQTDQTQEALDLQETQRAQLEVQAALIQELQGQLAAGDPMMGVPHMLLLQS